ncbi:ATP-dependent zinc metalloprotease FtsH [Desulfocurvibacter africanus]|uniref:ATP-dependent zinc metalloprotease FtsH n=2 Tax=Desulfocurvibacter africanus TaxID=873 RepID=F3Z1X8_DESAF|nr:ATP-dependent zinc metalloprotease FtsH [Desulfocurvibacter africanus]EGJ50086.1 ATP-dependent metalloprotease FtsH [Desulfocurvibacter africanus subsp. africanus str. Walvis Bay]
MNGSRIPGANQQRSLRGVMFLLFIALMAWVWISRGVTAPPPLSYSEFREQLAADNVRSVLVQGERIDGQFRQAIRYRPEGASQDMELARFRTYIPSFGDPELFDLLQARDVQLRVRPESDGSWLWLLLFGLLPMLFLGFIVWAQFRRVSGGGGGGLLGMGRSRAKLYDQRKERTTFDDVAGAEGAKEELQEIVTFLKDPGRVRRLGAQVPRGVLLVGPPGCGKTLLARAVAGEAGVPFFSITGSDFMEMFVGVGASRVRSLFEDAKKNTPSIIFIDELDSIGRKRGAGLGGGHDEREQTLNQLLSELDGFEQSHDVIVMSATNRPDILDPALLRPGRFDRRVTIPLPTTKARLEILRIHARNKPMAQDIDLNALARGTPGFSGADLRNLLNEAALMAARYDRKEILREDVEQARDKVLMGLVRQGLAISDEEKRTVAYHESGHALVAAVMPNADPLHKVSIVPRAMSMGVTQQLPETEKYVYTREYLLDRLAVMMGGRAAEELVLGTMTSGAGSDLLEATRHARRMVVEWGMSKRFSHMALGGSNEPVFLGEDFATRREYSEETAREVDEEVATILEAAYGKARAALEEHRQGLDKLAAKLLEEEELSGDVVLTILGVDGKRRPAGLF